MIYKPDMTLLKLCYAMLLSLVPGRSAKKHGQDSTALLMTANFISPLLDVARRLAMLGGLLAIPLLARGQNAFSPGGNDYVIASALAGDQTAPQAAVNASGGFLVWQDNAVNTNGLRIRAQGLNSGFTGRCRPSWSVRWRVARAPGTRR